MLNEKPSAQVILAKFFTAISYLLVVLPPSPTAGALVITLPAVRLGALGTRVAKVHHQHPNISVLPAAAFSPHFCGKLTLLTTSISCPVLSCSLSHLLILPFTAE